MRTDGHIKDPGYSKGFGLWALVLAALLCGCGKTPPGAGKTGSSKTPGKTGISTQEPPVLLVSTSSFTMPPDGRDPFFPAAKAAEEKGQAQAPVDIISLLEQGFVGVTVRGNERWAMIYDAILQPNTERTIRVKVGGREIPVKVRCEKILRNAVVLRVEGESEPVTIERGKTTLKKP